jgi:hypothetical protein
MPGREPRLERGRCPDPAATLIGEGFPWREISVSRGNLQVKSPSPVKQLRLSPRRSIKLRACPPFHLVPRDSVAIINAIINAGWISAIPCVGSKVAAFPGDDSRDRTRRIGTRPSSDSLRV